MILKVNDTKDFNISMNLNINYDLRFIEVTVATWNKNKNTMQKKCFPAKDFSEALSYYELQEHFLFGTEKA